MNNNGLYDIPQDAKEIILEFSNLDEELKSKLVHLWHLFKQFHNPLMNHNYKPIDKYVIAQEDQAEGEFILYVIQISYIDNKITDINNQIEIYKI
jgi:hypothetical protein